MTISCCSRMSFTQWLHGVPVNGIASIIVLAFTATPHNCWLLAAHKAQNLNDSSWNIFGGWFHLPQYVLRTAPVTGTPGVV